MHTIIVVIIKKLQCERKYKYGYNIHKLTGFGGLFVW